MGTALPSPPVKLITALMGCNRDLLAVARRLLTERFGPVDTDSEIYPFTFSSYYAKEMGDTLIKQFVSFTDLIDPGSLAEIKLISNRMEQEIQRPAGHPGRAVNIDPGYVTGAKLVLATTKDYSHRIYLGRGIYAELTLQFHHGSYHGFPWTYPDYLTDLALEYFTHVRRIYLGKE